MILFILYFFLIIALNINNILIDFELTDWAKYREKKRWDK